MVTPEKKAEQIYLSYVKCIDPTYAKVVKKHVHLKAIQCAKLHCIHSIDEILLITEAATPATEWLNQDTIYLTGRIILYQDTMKCLEAMI